VAEAFGGTVVWDSAIQTAVITADGSEPGSTFSGISGDPGAAAGEPLASAVNIGKRASTTADIVNLRAAATTESDIKRRLTPSDTLTITGVDGDWYQVRLEDGTAGYVAGWLVWIH
jgi:uncharacterized protein YgiM (DUF1202 family)